VNTMDDKKLREMLDDLAGDVSPHRTVPPSLERRVRARVAMNSTLIGALVLALGVGAFVTVRAVGTSKTPTIAPATSSTSTPATTTPGPCTSGQLRAVGSMSGAAGSRVGDIELRNYSDTTCTLTGTPTIALYDTNGKRITSGITFAPSPAQWQANGSAPPSGWPVVTVGAMGSRHDSAHVRIRWTNWCPQGRAFPLWRVQIPGSGMVDVIAGMDAAGAPPCNGPGMPSRVEVGPFEP
jgi:hypothetical protein